ncbi:hypothetical protein [Rhodococcus koreensis]|uniref:hypothetical protein n=1 Tax=Rhodococcus koreensis TaxID=99653 RepID=UPI0019803E49|nr:hypothetical protein [Rhodococcus koreensis]QSE87000.1 hypothetical protein JWS14_49395 [Rhodococcus koreensis]
MSEAQATKPAPPRPAERPNPKPTPKKPAPRPMRQPSGRRRPMAWAAVSAVGLAAVGLVGAGVWALMPEDSTGSDEFVDGMSSMMTSPANPAVPEAVSSSVVGAPAPACAEFSEGGVVTGAGPGGFASGPEAILGFDYAYYVDRSGARAREFTTPDAAVGTSEQLQKEGIDTIPADTRHCLRITTRAPDEYSVELTHMVPGADPVVWTQLVRTRTEGGRTLLASITDTTGTEK